MRWCALLLVACAKPAPSQLSPVQSVSVAPQSTGSPNEPVLLLGPQKAIDTGDVERVKIVDEKLDASFTPPKDRCPEGVSEMMAVHVPLGESMELPEGATPVSAVGSNPESVDVTYNRARRIVRITARKFGLVFVLTERHEKCTWYGVNSGY